MVTWYFPSIPPGLEVPGTFSLPVFDVFVNRVGESIRGSMRQIKRGRSS